jgi:glutamate-1-semialdehyde 2,1-aminomutase
MTIQWKRSQKLLERSKNSLAGGVSSPFRGAFPATLFFQDAAGAKLLDVDGNWYIDHVLAWGPLILGHKHPAIVKAVEQAAGSPHNYGAQHELEFIVAEQLCSLIPCAERVALTSSGSEAVQLAMRLARAFTNRNLIVKFEGHYHGWMDSALLSYHPSPSDMGPVSAPRVVLGSGGQVSNAVDNVVVLPWNDRQALLDVFAARGNEIAAIITEPVLCNSGCLMPDEGFLAELRRVTTEHKALLIFDEIITGFRIAIGGAQSVFGVTPDIATFGKAVGGGLPLSVVAGRKDILEQIPEGKVVFGGTFNGNSLSLAGAKATLEELAKDNGRPLENATRSGELLMQGICEAGKRFGIPVQTTGFGTAFSVHFTERSTLRTYRDTLDDDNELLNIWLRECLLEGVYLMPGGRMYTSVVHTAEEIAHTLEVFERVMKRTVETASSSVRARL